MDRVPAVFSANWQTELMRKSAEARVVDGFREVLGGQAVEIIDAFAAWLRTQPRQDKIDDYLRRRLSDQPG